MCGSCVLVCAAFFVEVEVEVEFALGVAGKKVSLELVGEATNASMTLRGRSGAEAGVNLGRSLDSQKAITTGCRTTMAELVPVGCAPHQPHPTNAAVQPL